MEVDYLKLYDLRKQTRLNIIEYLRLSRMRAAATKNTRIIERFEHCHLGIDFKEADSYEYQRRLNKYNKKIRG